MKHACKVAHKLQKVAESDARKLRSVGNHTTLNTTHADMPGFKVRLHRYICLPGQDSIGRRKQTLELGSEVQIAVKRDTLRHSSRNKTCKVWAPNSIRIAEDIRYQKMHFRVTT
eukprot:scaffold119592_cov28-Tisochrysis_lutea.AAC.1